MIKVLNGSNSTSDTEVDDLEHLGIRECAQTQREARFKSDSQEASVQL